MGSPHHQISGQCWSSADSNSSLDPIMFMFTQTLLPHGSMEGQQPEYVPGEGGVEQNHCLITSTIKEMSYNIPYFLFKYE